jgi:hypothetical protein
MSTKREKFVNLAEKRVNKALNDLRLIGNLANRASYEFDENDVKKIFRALQKELDNAKGRFSENGGSAGMEFRL